MSFTTGKTRAVPVERDERREAKTNVILQTVLFVPLLIIFGFTLFNIATAVACLILALIRWAFPSPAMRKFELWANIAIVVVWLFVTIL